MTKPYEPARRRLVAPVLAGLVALAAAPTATAGSVYVNGVNVDALRDQTFEGVTVLIDAAGNVHITAPRYQIELVDAKGRPVEPVKPVTRAPPVTATTPSIPPVRPTAGVSPTGIEIGRWWMVTEDRASVGHEVRVTVNGTEVRRVRSGEAQQILDLATWLHHGENRISIESTSTGAAGGPLYVYMGLGANRDGTVVMDQPQVQFGVGSSRSGAHARDYTVVVE